LLENGAKPYTTDKKGLYPIDYAGLFNKDEVVKLLINHELAKLKEVK
jgi:ankyrin repeat protein